MDKLDKIKKEHKAYDGEFTDPDNVYWMIEAIEGLRGLVKKLHCRASLNGEIIHDINEAGKNGWII